MNENRLATMCALAKLFPALGSLLTLSITGMFVFLSQLVLFQISSNKSLSPAYGIANGLHWVCLHVFALEHNLAQLQSFIPGVFFKDDNDNMNVFLRVIGKSPFVRVMPTTPGRKCVDCVGPISRRTDDGHCNRNVVEGRRHHV